MKVFFLHTSYLEPGGEDSVVESEIELLRAHGHEVMLYKRQNREIKGYSFFKKVRFALRDIKWSEKSYKDIVSTVKNQKPQVAHIHNPFIMMSPSVYQALREYKVPVVQTLHNYRFWCPNGLFFRSGYICEKCINGRRFPAIKHACWRNSSLMTAVFTRMLASYKKNKILSEAVDIFIATSEFSRDKFIEAGLNPKKVLVKQNFADNPGTINRIPGNYVLFVGRFVDYKGIDLLLDLCEYYPDICFKVAGDGPLLIQARERLGRCSNIEFLGQCQKSEVINLLQDCAFLIFPSLCYENMPRVIIEAFSQGVPVLAAKRGAAAEIVEDGSTGFTFDPDRRGELHIKTKELFDNKALLKSMGRKAQEVYQKRYTSDINYKSTMEIYNLAINSNRKSYSKGEL